MLQTPAQNSFAAVQAVWARFNALLNLDEVYTYLNKKVLLLTSKQSAKPEVCANHRDLAESLDRSCS